MRQQFIKIPVDEKRYEKTTLCRFKPLSSWRKKTLGFKTVLEPEILKENSNNKLPNSLRFMPKEAIQKGFRNGVDSVQHRLQKEWAILSNKKGIFYFLIDFKSRKIILKDNKTNLVCHFLKKSLVTMF